MDLRALYAIVISAVAAVTAGGWGLYEHSGRQTAERKAAASAVELKGRDKDLKALKEATAADQDRADQLKRQVETAAVRSGQLTADLDAAKDKAKLLEGQIADAARRQQQLEAEVATLKKSVAEGQAALDVARQTGLDASRSAKTQYDKDLAAILTKLKAQEDAAAAARADGERLAKELKASAAQVELLQKQVQDARAEERKDKADLRRLLDYVNTLTADNKQLTARNADLERLNKRLDDRNDSLERKVRDLERTIDKLKK
jgi:chromosome segregation ATPase